MKQIVHAPELDRPGLTWFNTPGPLSLARLRGKLVILDFWTYGCINCLHILPTLRRIETAFPDEVAVIGVHSPKFATERDPAHVRQAIARYGIRHPVAHDPDFALWRRYGVRAWPTLVLLSPDGYVIAQHVGEPDPDELMAALHKTLALYRAKDGIMPGALTLAPEPVPGGRFLFPGKIKPAPEQGTTHWALADAGHHQVVVLDDTGTERRRYGSGRAGFADGTANSACFNGPQGLIADRHALYVADTGNHAIRRIDLASGAVTTLAGTGRRGGVLGSAAAAGPDAALASPWDLELLGDRLLFANAGTHQLGVLDLGSGRVTRLAGAGPEGLRDGPAAEAHLAQPSGLALSPDGGVLYFADSETSAIRALDLPEGEILTLVGAGLFEFGHENGPFAQARLQHPLGLALDPDGRLLVADSYNNAVRVVDLRGRQVTDFEDGGFACHDPVCRPLAEPAGIWVARRDRVLLSDTHNHRVLAYRVGEESYRTWAA